MIKPHIKWKKKLIEIYYMFKFCKKFKNYQKTTVIYIELNKKCNYKYWCRYFWCDFTNSCLNNRFVSSISSFSFLSVIEHSSRTSWCRLKLDLLVPVLTLLLKLRHRFTGLRNSELFCGTLHSRYSHLTQMFHRM